jgi:hypothetical protein
MSHTDVLLRTASKLSGYERLLALRIAAHIIAGETYTGAVGPRRGRVLFLAGQIAARIERGASVGTVLS